VGTGEWHGAPDSSTPTRDNGNDPSDDASLGAAFPLPMFDDGDREKSS
jgi:hypothetical protein